MIDFSKINSAILLKGNCNTAYRDPAVYFHAGTFYLYFTLVETENDGSIYMYLAMTTSEDLVHFSPICKLSPRNQALNFSSPGNIIEWQGRYYLCCQTYCRENGEKFGNENSRIWLWESDNLINWQNPTVLRVKGDSVPVEQMGRMIDPFLIQDDIGEWYCFFKQNGVSFSKSTDLKHWKFCGNTACGENVCIIHEGALYHLWHSPNNGIGKKTSVDLIHWKDSLKNETLGQLNWNWAKGRLTAGMVLDLRKEKTIGKALMFFHGTGPEDESIIFDQYACIGFAWSNDLENWEFVR